MRLSDVKESKQQSIPPAEYTRSITLLIRDHIYHMEGLWEWDMHCQAVFCSDVLASPPRNFEGARAILFPDDVEKLFEDLNTGVSVFAFRIITSYGTVKQVQGSGITISEREMIATDAGPTAREMLLQAENRQLRFLNEIYEETEHTTQNAIWYYNAVTRETWYSNQYYRLHEIAPQSLNAHLNTFSAFIHPDDQEVVMEFRDKSYKERTPLHLVYRIVTQTGVKYLWYRTDWRFNDRGESVLFGSILDITEQQEEDRLLEQSGNEALFNRQLLLQDEQAANLGHWHMNLYTRKMEFSDMVFRLHGVKANTLRPGLNAFINFVHQEDRDAYAMAMKLMVTHHTPPDIEYRILRSDGKTRHLSQKAKLITSGMELLMACTIQDITVQRQLEKRLQEQTEAAGIQSFVHGQVEEMAKVGSWVWDIESGHIDWSDSLYTLLGLKPRSVELTQKRLLNFIFSDDQKKFRDELAMVLQQRKESNFDFRILYKGDLVYMKAAFRLMKGNKGDIFIGTIHNITKEFLLQAELHQRVQLAESLAENIIDKVLITDNNHTVVLWNKQCEEAFRISKAAALGKNFFDVFPQLNTADQIRLLNQVLEGETIFHPGLRSSWDKTFYNLHMMPVWSEDGTQINGIIHILHDITREMELRNSLSGRLGLIESLVESSLDRIIALDRNMNYLVWNRRCEEYFRLEKANVIGKNLLELFPGAQEEQTYTQFRRALRGEVVFVPAQKNESGNDYYEMYFIPVKDEKGEIIAILWVQHDITKEFLLTQQLGKQNRIYEYAEEITSMGTWSWNMETGKALYSDNMFRLFGLIPNEVEPGFENIPLFIHPEDRQVLLQNAERLKEGLESKDIEYRVTRKDGMQRIFRNRSQLIATEEDKHLVIGTTQDITEEILLRQKLAERQRYAEKLFDAGIDRMFVLNKDFIVQAWNKQCERYYSMSKEQVIGKSYLELFPKKAQDAEIMEAMQACFKGEMIHLPARQEIYLNIITECFYIPLPDEAGEVDSILCVWHDVTKAFHHREELRDMNRTLEEKNKELEEKNEEITTFSFVASHDLKEPLRKLHTFADWLMIHESENLSEKGRQFLNRIERSVHRMEMLIDDILVLSRINAEKQGHLPIQPMEVLEQVLDELKESIESSRAAITIHSIPVLNANQNQLFHLFHNLVSNALKFHKENAHPELEISSMILPSEEIINPLVKEATEYIKISFSDNGLGFEPRHSKRIFSVFQRLHGRQEFEGTGMGLAICKKIMENHNGFIDAKGEPDKGATFCCYFPVS